MITKEQAQMAFCEHCDDRPLGCQECPLRDIIEEIPDTPCPFCGNTDAVRAALDEVRT